MWLGLNLFVPFQESNSLILFILKIFHQSWISTLDSPTKQSLSNVDMQKVHIVADHHPQTRGPFWLLVHWLYLHWIRSALIYSSNQTPHSQLICSRPHGIPTTALEYPSALLNLNFKRINKSGRDICWCYIISSPIIKYFILRLIEHTLL